MLNRLVHSSLYSGRYALLSSPKYSHYHNPKSILNTNHQNGTRYLPERQKGRIVAVEGDYTMAKETRLDYCNRMIGEIATDLSQAYVQEGDFLSLYLGQISTPLQLSLFQPLALEISVFMVHLLKAQQSELADTLRSETEETLRDMGLESMAFLDERLDCYANQGDPLDCFTGFCQKAVEADAHHLNMEMNDKPIRQAINDRRFVAIHETASRLEQAARDSMSL